MPRRKKPIKHSPGRMLPDSTLGPALAIPDKLLDEALQKTGPAASVDALIGTKLSNRYKICEKIGEGGMGRIYLAEDERLGKKVVVKMLPPQFAGKVELAERFVQEARLTSQIEQENIVSITDLVVTAPPFYVMEHLRGTGLGDLIHNDGRLQWDERTQDMLAQVCRALGAAHRIGIVHRDMKPDNIYLVEHSDGRLFVKILDFGIAKLLSESGVAPEGSEGLEEFTKARTGRHHLTHIGTVLGTPHYMAPEQGQCNPVDHRSDIYAVGIIMYEMLTGQVPFDIPGRTAMDLEAAGRILEMHANEPLVLPRARRPDADIPEEIEAVMVKALQKDPQERFSDMLEMEAAILKCAAPKHKPRIRAVMAGTPAGRDDGRSMEGLARIISEENNRRKMSKLKMGLAIAAITAAVAGGIATGAAGRFPRLAPAVDSTITQQEKPPGGAPAGNDGGAREREGEGTGQSGKIQRIRSETDGPDE